MTELTSTTVHDLTMYCLALKNDEPDDLRVIDGVVHGFRFNMKRIEEKKDVIRELLEQLPTEFSSGETAGHSFLVACNRRDGAQWTGEHRLMESLFALGTAAGYVDMPLAKHMWSGLPGGMPYFRIRL